MDSARPAPGGKIGPFRIVNKLTEGGMGEIYVAHDDELNRAVAVKVLLPAALKEADGLARFHAEAQALARLDHPNIVRIHMAGQADGLHYMALEYIDGCTLDSYLTKHSPSLPEILKIFRQITAALKAAHDLEIIHRDIKPQNVMINRKGDVKLVDFGIAKAQTQHDNFKTTVGLVVGTRSFLAPEILRGAPATKQSDIFSLGLMLKFMLTGEMPTAQAEPGAKAGGTGKLNLLYPPAFGNLLTGMLQPNTSLRYTDLKDVLRDLQQLSFDHFPPDLLAALPNCGPVANLDKLIDAGRGLGLDVMEVRMAVNLAAKPGRPVAPADDGKTQVLNLKAPPEYQAAPEAFGAAVARVKQAKAAVLAGRLRPHSEASPAPLAAPAKPLAQMEPTASMPLPYVKIIFALVAGIVAFKLYSGGYLRELIAKADSVRGFAIELKNSLQPAGTGPKPASIPPPRETQ